MIAKHIKIKDLPKGFFKSQLQKLVVSDDTSVPVVAITGGANDWAAYIGWPTLDKIKPDRVDDSVKFYCDTLSTTTGAAYNGDKLSRSEAFSIFPEMRGVMYRE